LGALYELKENTDWREEQGKSKEYFDREFGRKSSMFKQNIICYPVEIVTDLRGSDDEGDEPTEEEIKGALALLSRSKKRKENKVVAISAEIIDIVSKTSTEEISKETSESVVESSISADKEEIKDIEKVKNAVTTNYEVKLDAYQES